MKTLILVNGAPGHRPFFSRVGDELARRGHRVVFAVDSHFTDFTYPDAHLNQQATYFSDYFRLHRGRATIPPALGETNLWLAMFPDFDRFNNAPTTAWRETPGYYRDLLAALTSFFWHLFEAHRFDRVVYEGVSNAFSYVAFLVAGHFGATYVGFSGSRLPNRIDVATTQYLQDSRLPHVYRELRSGTRAVPNDVRNVVQEYLARFEVAAPDYMVVHSRIPANPFARYLRKDSFLRVARTLRYQITQHEDREHAYQVPDMLRLYPRYMAWQIARSIRLRKLRSAFYERPDFSRPYFVYPMQFHPESSTSVNAPYYVDELALIRNISISLPVDASLYVKDHQHVAAARQSMAFYEEVRHMPNVVLIDPAVDPKLLVSKSRGVIASTSTMGYEAVVLGKPVYLFGATFYDFHPLCTKLDSYGATFDAIRKPLTFRPSAEDTFDFVAAYYLCTYAGSYDLATHHADPTLVETVASVIESPPVAAPAEA